MVSAVTGQSSKSYSPRLTLVGRVMDCWAGQTRPIPNMRVYVLDKRRSIDLAKQIEVIDTLAAQRRERPADVALIQEAERKMEVFQETLTAKVNSRHYVLTDRKGNYRVRGLRRGVMYFVVAIYPQVEDDAPFFQTKTLSAVGEGNLATLDFDFSDRGCSPSAR